MYTRQKLTNAPTEYTITSSRFSTQHERFIKVTVMSLYQSVRAALGLSGLITNLLPAWWIVYFHTITYQRGRNKISTEDTLTEVASFFGFPGFVEDSLREMFSAIMFPFSSPVQ